MAFTESVCSIINEKGRVKNLVFSHALLFRNKVAMISYILPHNPVFFRHRNQRDELKTVIRPTPTSPIPDKGVGGQSADKNIMIRARILYAVLSRKR